ncbi:FAD-dependent oxidoreductase [Microbacterium sp. TNHR37B]|uniref:FAD-dependent oxidoreductase n=1 Tax=Microbacterium sp. TNHR37B TaxID=1775956 RepID=UPI0007B2760D|nr:FAD-dependent oxidoreductase [Microbacterium sp. TNHR37B]KZE89483.1 Cytochrome b6-f complex iron-sulfur subunit 1 [Microbacterium sp. TNHR37B]
MSPGEQSLWLQTGPTLTTDDGLPTRSEVVVVGGGLAGLVAALLLCRRGHEVTLVEADALGGRTTSRTTGKVSLLQGAVGTNVRRHAGDDGLAAYLDANAAGAAWLRTELRDVAGAWEERTAYTYATTEEGRDALREEAVSMAAGGRPVALQEGAAEDIGLPFPVTAALHLPEQAQLHPVVAAGALAERVRAAGGRLVDHCRVRAVRATPTGVRLETERGRIVAELVVLATGTAVLDRSLLFAQLSPHRQAVVAFRLPPGTPSPSGMYLSADPVSRSVRSARDRDGAPALVIGGGDVVTGRSEGTGRLRDAVTAWTGEHYPGARPITWWAAQDYHRSTAIPFAGPIAGGRGRIFAMTGFAKWGMTNAPAAALAVDAALHDEPDPVGERLRRGSGGLRDLAATAGLNMETVALLVGGWAAPASATRNTGPTVANVVRDGLQPVAESTVGRVTCRLSAVCTHLGGIVRWNEAEETWDCPLHGSRFAPDGTVIEGPATRALRPREGAPEAQTPR